jgi:flagellar basal-body rod protein FlgC
MVDPLQASLKIAASGMDAQSARLRVITENLANAQSTGSTPGADPYQRKTVSFVSELDRASGVTTVRVRDTGLDDSPFKVELDPGNPAADEKGFVKLPNVDPLIEMADMREANRSYEANLQVARQVGELMNMTVNLLKEA